MQVLPKDFGGHADLVPIQDASPDGKSLGNGATKDATKPASQVGTENGQQLEHYLPSQPVAYISTFLDQFQ